MVVSDGAGSTCEISFRSVPMDASAAVERARAVSNCSMTTGSERRFASLLTSVEAMSWR